MLFLMHSGELLYRKVLRDPWKPGQSSCPLLLQEESTHLLTSLLTKHRSSREVPGCQPPSLDNSFLCAGNRSEVRHDPQTRCEGGQSSRKPRVTADQDQVQLHI
ncbi:Vacuolar Protein Sorting-Associated Protein 11 [Manis pentadactyla]|nr:Vacuolar Protein Sorting-Associated Protein 11 [Manis pentadactyla]